MSPTATLHAPKSSARAPKQSSPALSSPFVGVSWAKNRGKWQAIIRIQGKLKFLGYFPGTPEGEREAARTYDRVALETRGKAARLNFPLPEQPRKPRRRLDPSRVARILGKSSPSNSPAGGAAVPKSPPASSPAPPARPASASSSPVASLYQKPVDQLTPEEIEQMKRAFFSGW